MSKFTGFASVGGGGATNTGCGAVLWRGEKFGLAGIPARQAGELVRICVEVGPDAFWLKLERQRENVGASVGFSDGQIAGARGNNPEAVAAEFQLPLGAVQAVWERAEALSRSYHDRSEWPAVDVAKKKRMEDQLVAWAGRPESSIS